MTEEVKNEEIKQECFCKKRAKDVLVIALGSFVGVYCALSLFCALHKPTFPNYPMFNPMMNKMMPYGRMHHHKFPPANGKFNPEQFRGGFDKAKPAENTEQ